MVDPHRRSGSVMYSSPYWHTKYRESPQNQKNRFCVKVFPMIWRKTLHVVYEYFFLKKVSAGDGRYPSPSRYLFFYNYVFRWTVRTILIFFEPILHFWHLIGIFPEVNACLHHIMTSLCWMALVMLLFPRKKSSLERPIQSYLPRTKPGNGGITPQYQWSRL